MSREGDWGVDFPATLVEAVRNVKQARAAYLGYPLPEGPFTDTPSRTMSDIISERRFLSTTEFAINTPDVPPDLTEWAKDKIRLAASLRRATIYRDLYIERRMFGTLPDDVLKRVTTDPEGENEEINMMSLGEFRIEVFDGKPIIKDNSYSALFNEALEMDRLRQRALAKKLEGTPLVKISWLPSLLGAIEDLRGTFLRPELLENIFLVHYLNKTASKLKHKN
jgi:hypothetical protein